MKLDEVTIRLIAVGASVAANCLPCLEHNLTKALEKGADNQQIADAVKIGRMVRQGAASKMDEFVLTLDSQAPTSANSTEARCGCNRSGI